MRVRRLLAGELEIDTQPRTDRISVHFVSVFQIEDRRVDLTVDDLMIRVSTNLLKHSQGTPAFSFPTTKMANVMRINRN